MLLCGLPSCGEKATSDCASCKTQGYCSTEHQHDDWKAHKVECKRIIAREKRHHDAKGWATIKADSFDKALNDHFR